MPDTQPVAPVSLSFAKLVATPTDTAWSQAYNAGNLFVCLSLTVESADEELSLQALGKDLFNVFQSEFFTLQEKNTEHIKTAIKTSLESIPKNVTVNLTLAFFKESTLFVFIAGSGKIVMKRGEKIGVLLAKKEIYDGIITAASGYVENSDTLILETGQFAEGISQETFSQAFELGLPNDIVEALSPEMHKQDNGAQAAIVIAYKGSSSFSSQTETAEDDEDATLASLYTAEEVYEPEKDHESESDEREEHNEKPKPSFHLPKFPQIPRKFNLNHRRKLFLNISLILAVLLVLSIFFTMKKYKDAKEKADFQSIYPTAQQYYSTGKGLQTVNPSLSQDNFQKAQKLLQVGETKIPKGTKDYQQIADLLTQVDNALAGNATGEATNATSVSAPDHSLLSVEQAKSDSLAFGQDTNSIDEITGSTITSFSKNDGTSKDIIKNKKDWTSPVAVVPYEGNVYVLDPQKGLLKYVNSSGGFGKSSYFSGSAPSLTGTTSMAIDGSVWLLFKDGTISEYTKGKSNNLQITGLTKPLSNPTKIVTDINMENIYVLDRGNGRIAQFDKNGKYQNAYSSSVISTAKDFDVSEKDKKILILSGGKVWQIGM